MLIKPWKEVETRLPMHLQTYRGLPQELWTKICDTISFRPYYLYQICRCLINNQNEKTALLKKAKRLSTGAKDCEQLQKIVNWWYRLEQTNRLDPLVLQTMKTAQRLSTGAVDCTKWTHHCKWTTVDRGILVQWEKCNNIVCCFYFFISRL